MTERRVVRFDRLLTEVHIADDGRTRCGQEMPENVPWIDWTDDGTPRCPECFGTAVQEEAMF